MAKIEKNIIVLAQNDIEAIEKGSKELGCQPELVGFELLQKNSAGNSYRVYLNEKENKKDRAKKYLNKLESEILDIETDEIIEGFTEEELDDKGLIGNKNLLVKRSKYSSAKKEKEFIFSEKIEYSISNDYSKINDVPYEEIEYVATIEPNKLIAKRRIPGVEDKNEYEKSMLLYTNEYIIDSNIKILASPFELEIYSTIRGKVVILNDLIYVIKSDIDGYIILNISEDALLATMSIFPSRENGKKLLLDIGKKLLEEKHIEFGVDYDIIRDNIRLAESTSVTIDEVVVARGLQPKSGKDASFEMLFESCATVEDIKILPNGRVDYRRKANIPMAKKGQLLAKIEQPKTGINGMTIFGRIIEAKPGDMAVLYPGEHVYTDDNNLNFYAELDGQPVLNDNILSVFQHYTVEGDVNFNSGNIEFNGNVTINGSVYPGFEVKASGDITINGNCDGGTLSSGRDLIVYGGIIGSNNSLIKSGRHCIAHHTQNAHIEAQGDVTIKSSSLHTKIYCTGNIYLKEDRGAIVGGNVCALKDVIVRSIGSPAGTKTEVIVGHDFLIKKLTKEFTEAHIFCQKNVDKIETTLLPLVEMVKSGIDLDKQKLQRIALIIKKHKQLLKHLKTMEAKLKSLNQNAQSNENAMVKIDQQIYSDVKIIIKELVYITKKDYSHVSFYLDRKHGTIEMGSY